MTSNLSQKYKLGESGQSQADIYNNTLDRLQAQADYKAAQQADYDEIFAEYEAYGASLADWLPELLSNLGLSYTKKMQGENKGKSEDDRTIYMEIDAWHLDDAGFYFWMKTLPLPPGVTIAMILAEDVAKTLTVNINRRCAVEYNGHADRPGLWILVFHNEPLNKVPRKVMWPAIYKKLPGNTKFEVPVGVGAGKKLIWFDLIQAINVLIGGTTGRGKSNFVNGVLSSLLLQNNPVDWRLFLVDLKQGVEASPYIGLPHLGSDVRYTMKKSKKKKNEDAEDGEEEEYTEIETVGKDFKGECKPAPFVGEIIYEYKHLELLLDLFLAEIRRRGKMFRDKEIRSIAVWNAKYPDKKLSVWTIAWDEFAQIFRLAAKPSIAKNLLSKVTSIGETGRALGIGQLITTQHPDGDVVPSSIKANFLYTVAFWCANPYQSQALLNNRDAFHLLSSRPGEAIFDNGFKSEIVQTGFISDWINGQVIRRVKGEEYKAEAEKAKDYKIDPNLIWQYALDTSGGECNTKELAKVFSPYHEIRRILVEFEVKLYGNQPKPIINLETAYVLIPNEGNQIPRKLITLAEFEANFDKYRQLIEFRVSGFTKKNAVTKPVTFHKQNNPPAPVMAMAMEAA